MNLALILSLAVAPITTNFSYTQDDIDVLAKMVTGEGCYLLGGQSGPAAIAMVHTLLNHPRLLSYGIDGVAERYYYGYDPDIEPTKRAYRDVLTALVLRDQGYDMAHGARYVLSQQDLEAYEVVDRIPWAVYKYTSGPWGLYGFKNFPLEDKDG